MLPSQMLVCCNTACQLVPLLLIVEPKMKDSIYIELFEECVCNAETIGLEETDLLFSCLIYVSWTTQSNYVFHMLSSFGILFANHKHHILPAYSVIFNLNLPVKSSTSYSSF